MVRGERKRHDADDRHAEEDEREGGGERRRKGLNFLRASAVNAVPTLRAPETHHLRTAGIYPTLERCPAGLQVRVGILVRTTKKPR